MKRLIYENEYPGFESLDDWERDLTEAIDGKYNDKVKDISGEFQGTFFVKVWYEDNLSLKNILPKRFLEKYPEFKDKEIKLFYVRDNGYPIGVIVIFDDHIGWSLCHPADKWDVVYGIRKAIYKSKKETIDNVIEKIVEEMATKKISYNYYNNLGCLLRKLKIIQAFMKRRKNK